MWHIIRDIILEEVRRVWRRVLRRPEPEPPFARPGEADAQKPQPGLHERASRQAASYFVNTSVLPSRRIRNTS